ncbi:MAG: hypothetical protein HWE27_14275 [Gammaproteobacteria bacterium]|nr:hypothetical protein [Gammaproteobacteria bacterium]
MGLSDLGEEMKLEEKKKRVYRTIKASKGKNTRKIITDNGVVFSPSEELVKTEEFRRDLEILAEIRDLQTNAN